MCAGRRFSRGIRSRAGRTLYRAGQVVGLKLEELDADSGRQILDGGCGLAASGNGRVGTWTVPIRLAPGTTDSG
jgi:hypothetical protein